MGIILITKKKTEKRETYSIKLKRGVNLRSSVPPGLIATPSCESGDIML